MSTRSRKPKRARFNHVIQRPSGVIHPRVQKVGPEHFGIVSIDCAKARCKWMFADFYGNVLVPPQEVVNNRPGWAAVVEQVRQAMAQRNIKDLLVAFERTGRYHQLGQRACLAAGFHTRIVHPFATKQFRQASDPGNKTDDTDLVAIHRSAVNGCALIEAALEPRWLEFQLLIRHRRDLVQKMSALSCQIHEHLEIVFPGYAACFDKFWESEVAFRLVQHFESVQALLAAGRPGLQRFLKTEQVRYQQRTLDGVLAWAEQAASGAEAAAFHRRIALALYEDRQRKNQEIHRLEREIAGRLARTPYLVLLSFPGINVVSAADFAGEMGPISNYANPRSITGRAGLFPTRSQSDRVDHANGPLVRCANRKLRAAILGIADNLIMCNGHFRTLAAHWAAAGKDPRHTHVKVALRFCRIAYQMVAGRQLFHHPSLLQRGYVVDKLIAFHREHETGISQLMEDLQATIDQLPRHEHAAEAKPLLEELAKIQSGRRHGPQLLGDILPLVLARLGVVTIPSAESGESDLR